jgi:hypothetical protein
VRQCAATTDARIINNITDKFAYFSGETRQLEPFTYRWPLCDYDHRVELPVHDLGYGQFLNDQSFLVGAKGEKDHPLLEVVSPEGQVKFRQPMAKHEGWRSAWQPIPADEGGDRIALDLITMRGGNETLDISGHITARRVVVYDIETGKELASVPVTPLHRYPAFEFNLSPDGHRLAILDDDVVRIADIE